MSDDLLRPTIGDRVDPTVRPWRLNSQAYVAFFGGVMAATMIAWLNSGRLGLDRGKRWLIVGTGVVGLAAVVAMFALLNADGERTQNLRILVRVVAVVCILLQMRWQRPMDRAFQLRGAEYHSMWVLGPILVLVFGILEAVLLAVVVLL
ncbi:hypothetical protein E1263_22240 [Kribbella antibiotica]|uniref:Uncharacterized protein n=1 Tax=Kribbella antibiotica TaxID=190195 RepID=A0A4V2YPC0_9ACTN|nr:hypothetical protein [Kribbella antibiotica]TDD57757.1 hypothetical protein E1263_22240 [Kribbella antibiotica]